MNNRSEQAENDCIVRLVIMKEQLEMDSLKGETKILIVRNSLRQNHCSGKIGDHSGTVGSSQQRLYRTIKESVGQWGCLRNAQRETSSESEML